MNADRLLEARALVCSVTPMVRDCGRLCDAACCAQDGDGQGGVFLFPGEEALLDGADWGRIVTDAPNPPREGTPMLLCDGPCRRQARPLACMIFPLTPVVDEAGEVDVRFDCRARAMCPLVRHGLTGLRRQFVEAVRQALTLVSRDPDGLAFLRQWQALEEQYDFRL